MNEDSSMDVILSPKLIRALLRETQAGRTVGYKTTAEDRKALAEAREILEAAIHGVERG